MTSRVEEKKTKKTTDTAKSSGKGSGESTGKSSGKNSGENTKSSGKKSGKNSKTSEMSSAERKELQKRIEKRNRIRAYRLERRLGSASYYTFEILIVIGIILLFVKSFSMSFEFAHDVFYDSAKSSGSTDYVIVEISPDATTTTIAEELYEAGVIESKYVMIAKMKVGEYSSSIQSGTYGLSPSMTYSEILNIICGGATIADTGDSDATATDTDLSDVSTENLHDNSMEGAGEGEDEVYVEEESGGDGTSDGTSENGDTSEGTDEAAGE